MMWIWSMLRGSSSVQAVIDRIEAKNIEAVVCDTSTPSILNDVSVVEALVAANRSLHVLMVGRHVSSLPEETLAVIRRWKLSPFVSMSTPFVTGWQRRLAARIFPPSMAWSGATELGEIISNQQREPSRPG